MNVFHRLYSYGQLFAFSGIDGDTAGARDFCATFLDGPVTLRFETEPPATLRIPLGDDAAFDAIGGDFLEGRDAQARRLLIAFEGARTVVGLAPVEPMLDAANAGVTPYRLTVGEKTDGWFFRLVFDEIVTTPRTSRTPREEVLLPSLSAVEAAVRARRAWLESQPACPEPGFDELWAKCLSVEKENTLSPEGAFPCRWTTPDRVPHRDAWLWDSAFHAMAMSGSDPALARDALRAVLLRQREDGFIPHQMRADGWTSSITQPQVLAWAALYLHERAPDPGFLAWAAPRLRAFLLWTVRNRDRNGNGLLEWHTGSDPHCRCDESGLDNSPRFDFDDPAIDAIDFSCYLAHDAGCLSRIWRILERGSPDGRTEFGQCQCGQYAAEADALRERTAAQINAFLWDEADGLYYDRLSDGRLSRVASVASFLPLWAGICPPDRAARLVRALTDPTRFWTAFPVPSIAKDSPCYDTDMWRGCSWLNIDYFLWIGLHRYGYAAKAEELRRRVLDGVRRWYERHGTVFEFYDADDRLSPFELKRKGPPVLPPDWRKHMHSISDYHWSACFTRLFLSGPSASSAK